MLIQEFDFIRVADTEDRYEVARLMNEMGKDGWVFTGYVEETGGYVDNGTSYLMTRQAQAPTPPPRPMNALEKALFVLGVIGMILWYLMTIGVFR